MTGFLAAQRCRNLLCRSNFHAASARSTKSTGPVWALSCHSPRDNLTATTRTNLTLDFQTLLTQHSLVSATINLWQCSAFHQSGHSKWPIWSISTHPFSVRRCNNSVADGVPCGFSFFVANRPARLKAVVQASALSGFFMQPFHNRLRGAISHAARRHIDIILLFPCNRLIEKLGDPSGFNLVLDQRHPP